VFDIPKSGRPQPINGLHLVDWLVHDCNSPEPLRDPHGLAAAGCSRLLASPPSFCSDEPRPLPYSENAVALRIVPPRRPRPIFPLEDLRTELLERAQLLLEGLIDAKRHNGWCAPLAGRRGINRQSGPLTCRICWYTADQGK
jgi:hypothetical protein